jgi:hypothetical protein
MNRLGTVIFALASTPFAQSVQAQWTPSKRLNWTSGGSYGPAIVADASGGLHVAWYDYWETANQEIFYIRSRRRPIPRQGTKRFSIRNRCTSSVPSRKFPAKVLCIDETLPGESQAPPRAAGEDTSLFMAALDFKGGRWD